MPMSKQQLGTINYLTFIPKSLPKGLQPIIHKLSRPPQALMYHQALSQESCVYHTHADFAQTVLQIVTSGMVMS